MVDVCKEGRMQLALDAWKRSLYPSITAAAKAFNVPPSTLMPHVKGTPAREESTANGYSSYIIAGFDKFCIERYIILLYMPAHSSHILQPLNVSCFSPLERFHGQKT